MEQTECSEMLAYKIQTPGNYPEENIQHSEHGKSLKSSNLLRPTAVSVGSNTASLWRLTHLQLSQCKLVQSPVWCSPSCYHSLTLSYKAFFVSPPLTCKICNLSVHVKTSVLQHFGMSNSYDKKYDEILCYSTARQYFIHTKSWSRT
jgi:hypothetical protein